MLLQRGLIQRKPFWCVGQKNLCFISYLQSAETTNNLQKEIFPLCLLGIMPVADNQQAERYWFITCCWTAWCRCTSFTSAVSHTVSGWVISFCRDSLHFVKKPGDIEGIHHFTFPCQILAVYKQVLRHTGAPASQQNYKTRWRVGLTHCTSMDALMLITGAKYCPSETVHRIWGLGRWKPSILWGWEGCG